MIKLFTGYDPREAVGWHVFAASVLERTTLPVSFMPLHIPMRRQGSNTFTFVRFLAPYLRDFKGWALFVDGCDMLVRGDLAELWRLRDPAFAVQVVKHDYKTKHARKYVGTPMECDNVDYHRKNWASVMLLNCGHKAWQGITPQIVDRAAAGYLLGLQFIDDRYIGGLPPAWNWLVDEHGDWEEAQLLHWTAGIPFFEHYRGAPAGTEWAAAYAASAGMQTSAREVA